VELRVGNVFALPGGAAALPVLFTSGTNVVAAQFDLLLGSTNISSGGATGGSALADHAVTSGIPAPDRSCVVIYSPANASLASGVLVSIPLTLASNMAYASISLTLTNVLLANYDGGIVTNITLVPGSLTCTSDLPALPVFLTQPQSQTVVAGTNAVFSAIVAGEEPLTCQWRFNGMNLSGACSTWRYWRLFRGRQQPQWLRHKPACHTEHSYRAALYRGQRPRPNRYFAINRRLLSWANARS
jgi:hypothetical protein